MISLVHKTVFIHIPKCAGQSIEAAFCEDLGLKWGKHRYLLGCMERPPSWRDDLPKRLAHLSAHEIIERRLLPPKLFRAFYSFAVVRDPVARAVSMWRFLESELGFEEFVSNELGPKAAAGHYFHRPQKDFLCAPGCDELLVDQVIPFSRLSAEWPGVMRRAGLSAPLGHRNRAPGNRASPRVTARAEARIREMYAADYATFHEF